MKRSSPESYSRNKYRKEDVSGSDDGEGDYVPYEPLKERRKKEVTLNLLTVINTIKLLMFMNSMKSWRSTKRTN